MNDKLLGRRSWSRRKGRPTFLDQLDEAGDPSALGSHRGSLHPPAATAHVLSSASADFGFLICRIN